MCIYHDKKKSVMHLMSDALLLGTYFFQR